MSIHKQGRGSETDDSRIERHNREPLEDMPTSFTKKKTKSSITTATNQGGNNANLQEQLDLCRTFKDSIKEWHTLNEKVSIDLESAVDEIIKFGTFQQFIPHFQSHFEAVDDSILDSIRLLINHSLVFEDMINDLENSIKNIGVQIQATATQEMLSDIQNMGKMYNNLNSKE